MEDKDHPDSAASLIPTPRTVADHGIQAHGAFGASCLAQVPEIAGAVALVIARSSEIDMLLEQIVVSLLGSEGIAASTILRSVKTHHERQNLVTRLLTSMARTEDADLVRSVLQSIKPLKDIRNKFAHGIWGTPPIADHLMLSESRPWNAQLGAARQLESMAEDQETIDVLSQILMSVGEQHLSHEIRNKSVNLLQKLASNPAKQHAFAVLLRKDGDAIDQLTEVWSIEEAWKAAAAAEAAVNAAIGLQICMQRSLEEVAPLRAKLLCKHLLPLAPHTYLNPSAHGAPPRTPH